MSSESSSTALRASPRGCGEVVLIVDDEPLLAELAVRQITDLGYVALAFTSSRSALQALFDAPAMVDLVLTDESMPELSGSELVASIRARGLDIPIVLVSGDVTATLKDRARAAGVCEVLSKPLHDVSLATALACGLQAKRRQ